MKFLELPLGPRRNLFLNDLLAVFMYIDSFSDKYSKLNVFFNQFILVLMSVCFTTGISETSLACSPLKEKPENLT